LLKSDELAAHTVYLAQKFFGVLQNAQPLGHQHLALYLTSRPDCHLKESRRVGATSPARPFGDIRTIRHAALI